MDLFKNETIAAISTPIGEGGIGIVRLSGSNALQIAEQVFRNRKLSKAIIRKYLTHTAHYGFIVDPSNEEVIDETILTLMKGPKSYTREDMIEFGCHGGNLSLKKVLNAIISCGARMAEPGEFTQRAFLNGRIDLSQAEAVIDLIQAKTDRSLKSSIIQLEGGLRKKVNTLRKKVLRITSEIEAPMDFPGQDLKELKSNEAEERIKKFLAEINYLIDTLDYGKILKEGIKTVIVGKTNVGKSSLFNSLLRKNRAIVASLPGTTRDSIEELINIKGILFNIIDTAGLKNPENIVEKISIENMKKYLSQADLILALFDINTSLSEEDIEVINEVNKSIKRKKKVIVIENKIDLKENIDRHTAFNLLNVKKSIRISLKNNIGMEKLEKELTESVFKGLVIPENGVMINNIRQANALIKAKEGLGNIIAGIKKNIAYDFLTIDLKDVLDSLGELTGDSVSDEIVSEIFSRFCIGK